MLELWATVFGVMSEPYLVLRLFTFCWNWLEWKAYFVTMWSLFYMCSTFAVKFLKPEVFLNNMKNWVSALQKTENYIMFTVQTVLLQLLNERVEVWGYVEYVACIKERWKGQDILVVEVIEWCIWKTRVWSMSNIKKVLKDLGYGDVNWLGEGLLVGFLPSSWQTHCVTLIVCSMSI
jgi:hypothetical protein